MYNTKKFKFIFTVLLLILLLFIYFKIFNKDNSIESEIEIENPDENSFSSNIISEVNFASKDVNGNSYNVTALEGEVDFSNNQIIYLKKIKASVKSKNLNKIVITSDFGKYDTENFNTIFSKNVIIKYLDNKITAEYMDFSMESNLISFMSASPCRRFFNDPNECVCLLLPINLIFPLTKIANNIPKAPNTNKTTKLETKE